MTIPPERPEASKNTPRESRRDRLERERAMLREEYRPQYSALKSAAGHLGISWEEYTAHINAGEKWCYLCRTWRLRTLFKPGAKYCALPDSQEVRKEKLRKAWVKRRETYSHPMKGKKMSEVSRQRMREAARGRTNAHRIGQRHTLEARLRISQITRQRVPRGKQCHSYKDGKLVERRGLRFSQQYKQWRYDVFSRDKFTCQQCGDSRGGNLRAHHIKPFADYPELRFDVANGVTLCQSCHNKIHYGLDKA